MNFMQIDRDTCTKCGLCAVVCTRGLILFKEGVYPRPVSAIEEYCFRCGQCVAICPTASLDHKEIPLNDCPALEDNLRITPEQCEQLIKGRRSIRAYRDKPVSRDVIRRLIDIARFAPTGHNAQEVEWLVIDNPEELKSLEDIGIEWVHSMIENQSGMATMMDLEGLLKRHEKSPDTFLRGAPVLVVTHAPKGAIAAVDCTIALSYLDLVANSQGLGCCWAGFIYFMATGFPPMQKALGLPEGHIAGGCMMLGYPKHRYQRVPVRKPAIITWHDPV
jgi:nitroreductase/NAD-dependent dihydropyrimidine dehydrogenase PreA subunit